MLIQKDPSRSCGECSECCTVVSVTSDSVFKPENPGVPIWHKPERQTCQFVNNGGCSIYECRPKVCRGFECEWLKGEQVRKPSESGAVFFLNKSGPNRVNIMVGARTDDIYEDEKVKEEIQYYRKRGLPVVLIHNDGERTLVE